jgi:cell volume regulation protein A
VSFNPSTAMGLGIEAVALAISIGFLFGAIVSGTDPATLIPLFKEHKINKDTETIILTEAIFNGPLAIILTLVAFIFVTPEVPALQNTIPMIANTSLYFAATSFFLYQLFASILLALAFAILTYLAMRKLKITNHPYAEIFVLAMAFGAYVVGEEIKASGFLVVTVIAIILANYALIFKRKSKEMDNAMESNAKFTDILSTFSIILIFVLLGASLTISSTTIDIIIKGIIIALFVIFVARPIASAVILPKTGVRKYLFISFEGPKGAVAASMATLPVALGKYLEDPNLIYWGEIILISALMVVFLSMILESAWMLFLSKKLLKD